MHGSLYDKPVTTRLCEWTGIREHEAVGVLVTFWSGVAKDATNGFIRDYPDKQLEKWARWRRKPGIFAAWVRAEHMDQDGRVPEWDVYAGALERIREQDRRRKSEERRRTSNGNPADVTRKSGATRGDEDVDVDGDVDVTASSPPWAGERTREFFGRLADDVQRKGWRGRIDNWLAGVGYPGGRAAHIPDIEVGIDEYLANEREPKFGVQHVLAYIEKAEKRRKKPTGAHGVRSVADEAESNALAGALAVQRRMAEREAL